MEYQYITLKDNTKLYCACSLGKDVKTIIIVHGGPGNGFWDQTLLMEELAKKYNVIAFDQRGVNKSDEIKGEFTSEMLVDDIDEVRKIFNVDKASLIGHSYGGRLLLRYCLKYNEYVDNAIFVCPSFDFIDSIHTVIDLGKKEFENRNLDSSELANALSSNDFSAVLQGLMAIPEDIQNDVYGYSNIKEEVMGEVAGVMPSQEELQKSSKHQELIFGEGELCIDLTEKLNDLKCKSLLIVGDHDPVCSNRQTNKFKEYVKNGKVEIIKDSYHFPYLDKLNETATIINSFLEEQ